MPSRARTSVFFPTLIINASLCCTLFTFAAVAQNQNVEVRNAGGGTKEELVRNAAGQVVEIRTLAPDGVLRAKSINDYQPGYYVPQQTTILYFPDGESIKEITKNAYDPSANFISELVERFDLSGKHVSGHKLLHDPVNGEFRCWTWSDDSQKYDRIVCPSGEESGEKPPPLKPVAEADAIRMFQAARTAATAEQKSRRMVPKNMVTPPVTPQNMTYAIVIPAALKSGKQVSGSLVENAHYIRLRPELIVEDVTLPMVPGSAWAKLSGWRIEVAGSQPQPADDPFTFTVPRDASQIVVKLYPEGQQDKAVTKSIAVPRSVPAPGSPKSGYVAQPLCVAGDVCPIGGAFDGDATHALAAFDNKPATIVAETSDMAFIGVPEEMVYGKTLLFHEGNELLAFPVVIAQIDIVSDGVHLDEFQKSINQGDKKLVFAGVIAAQTLPEENWRAGMFPKSNLEWARRFVPDFQVPHESHAEREEREQMEKLERQQKGQTGPAKENEEKLGYIVFLVKNTTPDIVSWRGSKDQVFVLPLNPESFSQGDYGYKILAEASKTGTYKLNAALIPFVAPIQGQKFTLPASMLAK